MNIGHKELSAMLNQAAKVWRENADRLSEIDSRFGDGDHGVTILKIAGLIDRQVEEWDSASLKDFIDDLGNGIMAISGGSAGPLYGTLVCGLAEPLGDEQEIDGPTLEKMLEASLEAMMEISKARVGDKTMMDALIPAVGAAKTGDGQPKDILAAAAQAAAAGAKATEQYVAKFGRARSYGQETIGTQDVGAVSAALLFQALYEGLPA